MPKPILLWTPAAIDAAVADEVEYLTVLQYFMENAERQMVILSRLMFNFGRYNGYLATGNWAMYQSKSM